MELGKAQKIANEIRALLEPLCEKLAVAGSIRRQRPVVKDIDLVMIPIDRWKLDLALMSLGKLSMSGFKLSRVTMDGGTRVDIYFATPETFATLLLIRTGSVESNLRLCATAKRRGWRLCADGSGLFNERGERVAGDSERSIYEALGLVYQEPEERG